MEKFFKFAYIFKEYIIFFIAIILSFFLLITNENEQVEFLQVKLIDFSGKIKQNFIWMNAAVNAIDENRELREKVLYLNLENIHLKDTELENQRLRSMLYFKKAKSLKYLSADVVSKGFHQIVNSLQISAGINDGIEKNIPVITEKGLVGKIFIAGKEYSLVQMMKDVNFRVSAKILRKEAAGIVKWKTDDIFEMTNVPKSFDITVGDTIITSGYSKIYPPDIPIGIVSEVSNNILGMSKKISLKTFVDFTSIQEVFVIVSGVKSEFTLK